MKGCGEKYILVVSKLVSTDSAQEKKVPFTRSGRYPCNQVTKLTNTSMGATLTRGFWCDITRNILHPFGCYSCPNGLTWTSSWANRQTRYGAIYKKMTWILLNHQSHKIRKGWRDMATKCNLLIFIGSLSKRWRQRTLLGGAFGEIWIWAILHSSKSMLSYFSVLKALWLCTRVSLFLGDTYFTIYLGSVQSATL